MLRQTKEINRNEVAASFGDIDGIISDVQLLFGAGADTFKGAMHELALGRGPTTYKHVRGSIRVGAFLKRFNPDAVRIHNLDVSIQSDAGAAVIIVRIVLISSFFFYCLLLNHSFPTNPNRVTNCLTFFSLLQLYQLHLLNASLF